VSTELVHDHRDHRDHRGEEHAEKMRSKQGREEMTVVANVLLAFAFPSVHIR
jgi:hypothetical protein